MHWKGGLPPPPSSRAPSLCPATVPLAPSASLNGFFVTDSNRPRPLWQPPPTAHLTASGAASEAPSLLMHPCWRHKIIPMGAWQSRCSFNTGKGMRQ